MVEERFSRQRRVRDREFGKWHLGCIFNLECGVNTVNIN